MAVCCVTAWALQGGASGAELLTLAVLQFGGSGGSLADFPSVPTGRDTGRGVDLGA